jgi:hypothetical protein
VRRERSAELVTCATCGNSKGRNSQSCRQCSLLGGYSLVIGALAQHPYTTAHELAAYTSTSVRGVYRALARARDGGGLIDAVYEGRARASVARYRLVKTPTWYRP